MPLQDPLDCGRRDIDLVIALEEEADPERPVLALPADLQDQGDDVGGSREGVIPRSSGAIAEARQAVLPVPGAPHIEESP